MNHTNGKNLSTVIFGRAGDCPKFGLPAYRRKNCSVSLFVDPAQDCNYRGNFNFVKCVVIPSFIHGKSQQHVKKNRELREMVSYAMSKYIQFYYAHYKKC